MIPKVFDRKNLFIILTALLLLIGGFVWLTDLDADPPRYFSGLGQSLGTDPYHYLFHARNQTLYGDSDPFNYPRWVVFESSLISFGGLLLFSVAEVSRANANALGVAYSLIALLLIIAAVLKEHRWWVTSAISAAYLGNVVLTTHGRLPYLENGLLLWSALLLLVFTRWGHLRWGAILSGMLVAMAALTGKLFGAVLIAPVVLAYFFSESESKKGNIACSLAGFMSTSTILAFVFYSGEFDSAWEYLFEQSYGLYGGPEGLSSPLAFLEHLISYGFSNRLFNLAPDIGLLLALGFWILARRGVGSIRKLSATTRFAFFWTICSYIGLALLSYSPVRYSLLLVPAAAIFAFTFLDETLLTKKLERPQFGWGEISLLLFAYWFVLYHAIGNSFFYYPAPGPWLVWATLPGAIVLVFATRYLVARGKLRLRPLIVAYLSLFVVLFTIVHGVIRTYEYRYYQMSYDIKEANSDMAQILGPGAVVSGPYGPTLTFDTNVRSFVHHFGVAKVDATLFDRQPITHIAVDGDSYMTAEKYYPNLRGMVPITNYYIRSREVRIFDISKRHSNRMANGYRPTAYEEAVSFYHLRQPDSALAILNPFFFAHPVSKSARLLMADLLAATGHIAENFAIMERSADLFPTDFYIQAMCGQAAQRLGLERSDGALLRRAEKYYRNALTINSSGEKLIDDLRQTAKQYP